MKKMLFYVLLFSFVGMSNAQKASMNINRTLQSQREVTASQIPTSGWFQLVADKQVEGLKLKPIQAFQVAPNPATNVVTLSQPRDKVTAGTWQIFDAADTLVWSQKVNDKDIDTTVGIHNLSEGIYFVSFSINGQKRFNQKLVKIKSN